MEVLHNSGSIQGFKLRICASVLAVVLCIQITHFCYQHTTSQWQSSFSYILLVSGYVTLDSLHKNDEKPF